MKTKLVNYYLFSVPVSFEISKIHIPYSRHIIIELEVNGKKTIGEGVSYKSSLSRIEKYIFETNFNHVNFDNLIRKEPGLAAAIDQAINSSAEKSLNSSLQKIDYTKQVFIQPTNKMVDEVVGLVKSGCKDIKLKLGRQVEDDIALIKILMSRFPKINFKADVNGFYNETIYIIFDKRGNISDI